MNCRGNLETQGRFSEIWERLTKVSEFECREKLRLRKRWSWSIDCLMRGEVVILFKFLILLSQGESNIGQGMSEKGQEISDSKLRMNPEEL